MNDKLLTHDANVASQDALRRCRLAYDFEQRGNYEQAREALGDLWRGVGERPCLKNLDQLVAAEVLLRAGTLSGWLGSAHKIVGANQTGQTLLGASIALFELHDLPARAVEAEIELAWSYWREGNYAHAAQTLNDALERLDDEHTELRAVALVRLAEVERLSNRLHDSLATSAKAAPLVAASINHTLKGRFYNTRATVLKDLGADNQRADYTKQAFTEYAAASIHFEKAGHTAYHAAVENNLGDICRVAGRYREAHHHLNNARQLFINLQESVYIAQTDDSRAQIFIAEEQYERADALINEAVKTLETSEQPALLSEALTTQGLVLARRGRQHEAREVLQRARQLAERYGDRERAGRALLTLIEEQCDLLSDDDRSELYTRADQLLSASTHYETRERLACCKLRVREAHAEHERQREVAAQTEKLAALGKLAYGVAHDFNNLLTAILGTAQLASRHVRDDPKTLAYLETIKTAAGDGAHMIGEIQDYARQERVPSTERVDIKQLFAETREITGSRIAARSRETGAPIRLRCDSRAGDDDLCVFGDAAELRRVLVNIVYNAADAMPGGGAITLAAEARDGHTLISISDEGTGMTEEVRGRIFDPFFTTKGKNGTGMGMAVSYGIIRRHEGTIEVESAPGVGTTFRISLPTATPLANISTSNMSASNIRLVAPLATERVNKTAVYVSHAPVIMLVDDDAAMLDLISLTLQEQGCEVLTARNGEEALRMFGRAAIDGLITDINMPGMNGWELARRLREIRPQLPVAVITGGGEATLKQGQTVEANWIVTKPFKLERIVKLAAEVSRHCVAA